MRYLLLLLLCTICCCLPARADVELSGLFSDNMVLQRDKPIAVYGTADANEIIGVKLGDQAAVGKADKDGNWLIPLRETPAGGPFTLTVHGKNEITIKNVMVGDVWMFVGSSSMGASYADTAHTEKDTADANLPELRLFRVPENSSPTPVTKLGGAWKVSTSESIQNFSSIGFYVGRDLHEKLHVPVGVIQSTYPASPIITWISRDSADNSSNFKNLGAKSVQAEEEYKIVQGRYEAALDEWNDKVEEAHKKHQPEPPIPPLPPPRRMGLLGSSYNGQINPLVPYTMRGVFFYQGENDVAPNAAINWRKMFEILVQDCRTRFKVMDLPFYLVQLPSFGKRLDKPGESWFAEIRETQYACRVTPYVYVVNSIDTDPGVNVDINPRDKRMIALRLSRAAQATQYHMNVPWASPVYDSMETVGDKIRVHFRNAEKGLISKGLPVKGFQISGADEKFVWANAQMDADSVLVSSDKVSKPVAVRYGWADNPEVNLYNADKMPVVPFRTDDWHSANPAPPKK